MSIKFVTGICQIEVIYRVLSNTFAFTHHQLEKIASTFDVDVGQLLLFETTNLNNAVLVGSKRTIYFSTETSKQSIKYLLKYHCFPTILNLPLQFRIDIVFISASSTLIQVLSEWMLHEKSLALTRNALTEPTLYNLDEENRRRFPASPAYDILITVVNPDPEKLKIDWNLREMVEGG